MAINLLENASTTAPVDNTDWVNAQALVSANQAPQRSILTGWASTDALPSLKQGAFIRYEGNTYQIQSNDAAISGSISSGVNYIVMTASGTVLTASLTNDLTDYAYDPAYGGIYNGDLMLLRDIVYYADSAYNRGWSLSGADFNSWVLASGEVSSVSTDITTVNATTVNATTINESGAQLGLGVNQTWHDVSASRSIGSTYTNSNDKPIQVSISVDKEDSYGEFTVTVGGVKVMSHRIDSGDEVSVTFIVPSGNTYIATLANCSVNAWSELY